MKRTIIVIALVVPVVTACTKSSFLGTDMPATQGAAICFTGGNAQVTKRVVSGAEAAALLGGSFTVSGAKGNGSTRSLVFNGYNVKWTDSSAGSTGTNASGWEYVGLTNGSIQQSVKYWDYNTAQYDFVAYSKESSSVTFSSVNFNNLNTDRPLYTITGQPTQFDLPTYIADVVTVSKANYGKAPVNICFRPFKAKIRFGMYETIPGYSIDSVFFYQDVELNYAGNYPVVYTEDRIFPTKNDFTYSVYSERNGKVLVKNDDPATHSSTDFTHNIAFSRVIDYSAEGILGTSSSSASFFLDNSGNSYTDVLPLYNNNGSLIIRVDYTLKPTDGSDTHRIKIKNAQAVIPAEFINWQPGYAYTYLFKISEGSGGLYPIVFDAEEYLAHDPLDMETIESEIPITTYQKGSAMEMYGAYNTHDNIYVTVGDYRKLQNRSLYINEAGFVRLYYVEGTQKITEENIRNCLNNGVYNNTEKTLTTTDALGRTLVLKNESSKMSILDNFQTGDSPGVTTDMDNAFACISGQEAGIYVFVYDPASYSNDHLFCTLPKGQDYYIYEIEEYDDGNVYYLDHFESDGTEKFNPDTQIVSDLGLEYYNCVSDPDYDDSWYIKKSDNLPAGLPFYVSYETGGKTYYGEYTSVGTEYLYADVIVQHGAYRLEQGVYFENYEPGYTIKSGEPYYEVHDGMLFYDGNRYTAYTKGSEYPVLITENNKDSYVYAIRNQEKITEYPSGNGLFPFERVERNNNTLLYKNKWYFAIDGLDIFRDDDGTYDDGTSICISEYQANGNESSLIASPDWWDGDYGLWYDGCSGPGSYFPTFLFADNFNTLVTGEQYCYFENDNTKRTYIANGTEGPDYSFPTNNGLYLDDPDTRQCIKIIEVK